MTLVSRDGMRFRVSSIMLKATSGCFATTLSLPQSPGTCPKEAVIDHLDEDAQTIEGLLRMVTGKECPQLDTLEVIEPLLLAAEKWDMPGPSSILKLLLQHPSIVSEHPLRLYWLGCHLGWDGMTKLASKFSCNSHIYSSHFRSWLQRLASTDLIRLMEFHRNRRNMMRTYLEGGNLVSPDCPRGVHHCVTHTHAYQIFQWRFLEHMELVPPGRCISEDALQDLVTSSSLQLDRIICPKLAGCNRSHWSTPVVLARIQAHWSTLPQTV